MITFGNDTVHSATIQLFDNTGRMIMGKIAKGLKNSIDKRNLFPGLDWAKVSNGRQRTVKQIVKMQTGKEVTVFENWVKAFLNGSLQPKFERSIFCCLNLKTFHYEKILQNLRMKQAFTISFICLITAFSAKAQTDYVLWAGNSDAPGYYAPTTVVGNLTADSVRFAKDGTMYGSVPVGSYVYGNGSWTNNITGDAELGKKYSRFDFQNTYPGQTGPGWPAGATDTLAGVWIQYRVSPNAGYKFTVKSLSFDVCGSGTGLMRARAFISTSPTFKTCTEVLPLAVLGSYVFTNVSKTDLNVVVDAGKTFFLRVYPWMADLTAPTTGKRIIVRSVKMGGITEAGSSVSTFAIKNEKLVIVNQADILKIYNAADVNKFEILSSNGKLIKTVSNSDSEVSMNISNLKSGMYILKGFTANGLKTGKFIR